MEFFSLNLKNQNRCHLRPVAEGGGAWGGGSAPPLGNKIEIMPPPNYLIAL